MVRSIKNTFAPINRVPPDVLSLIPGYCDTDKELIALTHVCRSWREIFISHASLWTSLDCTNLNKTDAYIKRSRESPLQISLAERHCNDAFLLTIPHIGRLKDLALFGASRDIPNLLEYFRSPAPLLEKLDIDSWDLPITVVGNTLFDGNLLSLRELCLYGVLVDLSWKNLANLTTFDFRRAPGDKMSITQLLDLFEHAPLREIKLKESLPDSSDAPVERVVSLPHLRLFRILAQPKHSILLNHLRIPIGASVILEFQFGGERSPIPDYLPRSLDNLGNISHITSINFHFGSGVYMRLKGPNGGLYVLGFWRDRDLAPPILYHRILQSLNKFPISAAERLTITQYDTSAHPETEESGDYQALLRMNNLRTLTLNDCIDPSFVFALNPNRNASSVIVCPGLEEIVLHIREQREVSIIDGLLEMAKERASRGAGLSTVVIVCSREFTQAVPAEKVFGLRKYVSRVEYRLDDESLGWYTVPGEVNDVYEFDEW